MPIAMPPPDADPTIAPRSASGLTEAERRSTGLADADLCVAAVPDADDNAAGFLMPKANSRSAY